MIVLPDVIRRHACRCEWAEMELRHECYKEALGVLRKAVMPPRNRSETKSDKQAPVATQLFRNTKIWGFYLDMEVCASACALPALHAPPGCLHFTRSFPVFCTAGVSGHV